MVYLIRILLIGMIIYLIIRMFVRYFAITEDSGHESGPERKKPPESKKISRKTGEYIDYEEVDK
jgi:hypothetical protein